MPKFKGRLLYMGWSNLPWKLVAGDVEIDLWPIIDKFLASLNGKRANHEETLDGYTLLADESSEFRFEYIPGERVFLKKIEGLGFSSVKAYLGETLGLLTGRLVEIEDGRQMKFTADASEEVYGVYFTDDNSCKVPSGIEETVCKLGQHDCCIFLALGVLTASSARSSTAGKRAYSSTVWRRAPSVRVASATVLFSGERSPKPLPSDHQQYINTKGCVQIALHTPLLSRMRVS